MSKILLAKGTKIEVCIGELKRNGALFPVWREAEVLADVPEGDVEGVSAYAKVVPEDAVLVGPAAKLGGFEFRGLREHGRKPASGSRLTWRLPGTAPAAVAAPSAATSPAPAAPPPATPPAPPKPGTLPRPPKPNVLVVPPPTAAAPEAPPSTPS